MAWDNTQPTNTTKIRNLGVVIRPNWLAIQQADSTFQPYAINFTDRTAAGLPVNPTAIGTAYILYSKQDAAGNPELFGINSTSGVTQFTRGVPTTAQPGSSFLPGGAIIKWGIFSMGAGVTSVVVPYATPFPSTFWSVVIGSTTADSRNEAGLNLAASNVNQFTAFRSATPASNQSYYYIAIGN